MGGAADITSSSYPVYLQQTHAALLTGDAWDLTNGITFDPSLYGNVFDSIFAATAGVGGSPYAGVEAYDPADDMELVQTRYDEWAERADDLDPDALVAAHVTAGTTAAGTLVSSSEIDDTVAAFEARSQGAFLRNVSRFASGMFDIGAVMSTQYFMGLASMELDRQEQLNDLDARLRLLAERERYEASMQLSSEMTRLYIAQLNELRAGVGGQLDISRIAAALYQDQIATDLGYEVSDATWDLELYQQGIANIGALSGALQTYRPQTKGERIAAAVTTSASFGIQTGTALGSPAAGVVGGVGMLATQLLTGIA